MKYFKLIYQTIYFTLLALNSAIIVFSILSSEDHFDLFLPIEIILISLFFCFKYFSKNKVVFYIFLVVGLLSVTVFFQQIICPEYKNCMPSPCPYGPMTGEICNSMGEEWCDKWNESEMAKKSCDDWKWSEEESKKIKWYCKGRTGIVQ